MESNKDRLAASKDPAASVLYLIAREVEKDEDSDKLNLELAFGWSGRRVRLSSDPSV